jgi:ribonuclease T2
MMHASGLITGLLVSALTLAVSGFSAIAQERRGAAAGDFDFYVLALSWSPGFCATGGEQRGRKQCDSGAGLGFVVHGLWPQNENGYPTQCGPAGRTPSRLAIDEAKGLFPDEGLARHSWRKHGTCSGKSPSDYFADVRKARESVKLPPEFEKSASEQRWTPIDLERAFAAANPGLRTDMMSVTCKREVFQEIRICMQKDLRGFRACEQVDRSGCRGGQLTINAVR